MRSAVFDNVASPDTRVADSLLLPRSPVPDTVDNDALIAPESAGISFSAKPATED